MIINITRTQLSSSNKALINAAFDANLDASNVAATDTNFKKNQTTDSAPIIIFSGDGVFAQSSIAALFAERLNLSPDTASLPSHNVLFAVKADVEIRGACVKNNVSLINHQEFAELANGHQQWVTL
jgi:sulfur transfer complex TusBCD TusB component (DsrH family)